MSGLARNRSRTKLNYKALVPDEYVTVSISISDSLPTHDEEDADTLAPLCVAVPWDAADRQTMEALLDFVLKQTVLQFEVPPQTFQFAFIDIYGREVNLQAPIIAEWGQSTPQGRVHIPQLVTRYGTLDQIQLHGSHLLAPLLLIKRP